MVVLIKLLNSMAWVVWMRGRFLMVLVEVLFLTLSKCKAMAKASSSQIRGTVTMMDVVMVQQMELVTAVVVVWTDGHAGDTTRRGCENTQHIGMNYVIPLEYLEDLRIHFRHGGLSVSRRESLHRGRSFLSLITGANPA